MLSLKEEREAIKKAIAQFPEEFGLRAFPGDKFRLSENDSYYSQGYNNEWGSEPAQVMLYTQRLTEDGTWCAFAKSTIAELKKEIRGL